MQKGFSLRVSRRFPGRFASRRRRHAVLVGVGGNLGDAAARFDRMVDYIRKSALADVVATSPLLKNPPFGYLDQPDFLNGVMVLSTDMDPFGTMRWLLWVEKRFGRKRTFKNAPRTLDLDIIFFDERKIRTKRLHVPHPRYRERPSVTVPMMLLEGEYR